jgi:2-isopropylmalate synthase
MTYEIMRPESVGVGKTHIVLGKHSGRHAFKAKLEELGYRPSEAELEQAFERLKRLADQKKEIFEEDLETIVSEEIDRPAQAFRLVSLHVESGTGTTPTATVELVAGDRTIKSTGHGDGPVDAAYRTIAALTQTKSRLVSYVVKGITGGTDALGEVTVAVEEDGRSVSGHGSDTDIIIASVRAYLSALNKLAARAAKQGGNEPRVGLI